MGYFPLRRLWIVTLLAAAGCSAASNSARPDPDTQPLPNAVSEIYDADIDALADHLLPAALAELHWAALSMDNQVTALRLTALNAADQQIEIRAQNVGHGRSAVQIRVGYFGDEKLESVFRKTLADVVKKWREKKK